MVGICHRAMAQRRRCSDVPSRAFGAFYVTRFDSDPSPPDLPWRSAGAAPTYFQGPSVPSTQPDSILTLSGATVDAAACTPPLRASQLNEFSSGKIL